MLHRRRTVGSSPSDKKNATLPVVEEVELLKADEVGRGIVLEI